MKPAILLVVILLSMLKSCVEEDAQRGNANAQKVLDATEVSWEAGRDYATERAWEVTTTTAYYVLGQVDEFTSSGLVVVRAKLDAVNAQVARARERAGEATVQFNDFKTSAGLAAGDLREGAEKASRHMQEAWKAARKKRSPQANRRKMPI